MGRLDEVAIAGALVKVFSEELLGSLDVDVAMADASSAGLTTARYLAKAGLKVNVFERKLYVGGVCGEGVDVPVHDNPGEGQTHIGGRGPTLNAVRRWTLRSEGR